MGHIIGQGRYRRETYPQAPILGPTGPTIIGPTGPTGSPGPASTSNSNWVTVQGIPHSQTQSTLNGVVPLMAAGLFMKFSGIPQIDAVIPFRGSVAGLGINMLLQLAAYSPPIASRFAAAGSGVLGAPSIATSIETAAGDLTPTDWAAMLGSDSAGVNANTLAFDGAPLNLTSGTLANREVTSTGVTTQADVNSDSLLVFSGAAPFFLGPNIANQGVPLGTFVVAVLYLFTNAGGAVVSFSGGNACLTLGEKAA
jgi:hypothetical protein